MACKYILGYIYYEDENYRGKIFTDEYEFVAKHFAKHLFESLLNQENTVKS